MNKIIFLIICVTFLSCKEGKNKLDGINPGNDSAKTINIPQQTDSTAWINDFSEFRNAVYQRDKNKVKQFIGFPIMNYQNEIWGLLYEGNEKGLKAIPEEIKPFTEQDFDKYFSKLFSKRFVNTILKIKSQDLFTRGDDETMDFKEGNTTYKMYATFDKKEQKLSLILHSEDPIDEGNGEIFNSEYSIGYEFDISKDGKLRFRQIRLAG